MMAMKVAMVMKVIYLKNSNRKLNKYTEERGEEERKKDDEESQDDTSLRKKNDLTGYTCN